MEHKKHPPRNPKIKKIREDKISGKVLYFFLTGKFQGVDESILVDLSLQNFHGWLGLGLGRVSHIYLGEKKNWDGNYKIMLVECFKEVKGKKLKELKNEMKVSEDFTIEICAVKPLYKFKPIVQFRIDFENTSCFEVKYNFEVTRIASASQVEISLVLRIRNLLFRRMMEKNYQKAEMPWRKRR